MENKEKNYNLNLDSLVPFFLIGKEELDKRVWFKGKKEEYKEIFKECYESLSTVLEEKKEEIIKWENENWKCDLLGKKISFVLEKKKNSNWKEVKFIEKIFFSNWNIEKDSFELQIKKTIEIYLKKRITSFSEHKIKFKLRFHGKSEPNKPDILITLIDNDKSGEIKKDNKIALEITQADTSPPGKSSFHEKLDGQMEKGDFKGARETKKILDKVDTSQRLLNLFKNAKKSLLKKNNKNYYCGKTVVWVILLAYCHVDVESSITGEETCLALKNKEVDEKKFSRFLLEGIKKISKEFQSSNQDLTFDHLIVKFAETNQKMRHEGKWYKFTSFVKEILHIPVVSGEIRVEEELKRIDEEYKDKLDNLRISPREISLNWETTKLLMDDDERKYYENREIEINPDLIKKILNL